MKHLTTPSTTNHFNFKLKNILTLKIALQLKQY